MITISYPVQYIATCAYNSLALSSAEIFFNPYIAVQILLSSPLHKQVAKHFLLKQLCNFRLTVHRFIAALDSSLLVNKIYSYGLR